MVCFQIHFKEDQFESCRADGKKLLKWNAMPTIFTFSNADVSQPSPLETREQSVVAILQDVYAPSPLRRQSVLSVLQDTHAPSPLKRHQSVLPLFQVTGAPVSNDDHHYTKRSRLSINENLAPVVCDVTSDDTPSQEPLYVESGSQTMSSQTTEDFSQQYNAHPTLDDLKRKIKHLQRKLRFEHEKTLNMQKNISRFLNPDQLQFLKNKRAAPAKANIVKWSNKTIKDSLRTRCATGVQGYEHLRKEGYPLPSYRTLCSRVESAQFRPGLQTDVMEWLQVKITDMPEIGRDCVLALDEMQLRPTVEYDKGWFWIMFLIV